MSSSQFTIYYIIIITIYPNVVSLTICYHKKMLVLVCFSLFTFEIEHALSPLFTMTINNDNNSDVFLTVYSHKNMAILMHFAVLIVTIKQNYYFVFFYYYR